MIDSGSFLTLGVIGGVGHIMAHGHSSFILVLQIDVDKFFANLTVSWCLYVCYVH